MAASSSSNRIIHDVFLSFRGEDTRYKFVDHLYNALYRERGIDTFRDDKKLQKGESISPSLSKAIEESRVWIVVFSKNYADSRWCLDELVKILECKKTTQGGRKLYPVFYEVEPTDVRHQKGEFGKGFEILASRTEFAHKVPEWRQALKEVADLKGSCYSIPTHGYESEFIQELASEVFLHIRNEFPPISCKGLIGIGSRVEEVTNILQKNIDEVGIVGVWGMGGIGKSTIAQVIYDYTHHQFDKRCFLSNIREVANVITLQEQLILHLSEDKSERVPNASQGLEMISRLTRHRRILIVLDDVDDSNRIKKLVIKDSLGHGSRIIITTRDKRVLTELDVDDGDIYKVEPLENDDSRELFILKAFRKDQRTIGFEELICRATTYAKGVPLAVNVLGSFLRGRSKCQWESALNKLEEWPEEKIMKVLRLSYEELDRPIKDIFLDIACHLNNVNKDHAISFLDSCGFYGGIGIGVLIDKSLISIWCEQLSMHDLLVDLGRHIVREESDEPGERSRLWNPKDVIQVLTTNTGTRAVKSIVLKEDNLQKENLVLDPNIFVKMTELRVIRMQRKVILSGGLRYIPNGTRIFEWNEFPLQNLDLSRKFYLEHLVELRMPKSSLIQLWEGEVHLNNLKIMDLSYSRNLIKTPNFTGVMNLENLYVNHCESLVEVHPSIVGLKKLLHLNLSYCGIRFSEITGYMESLLSLDLSGSIITEVPNFVEFCGNLKHLHINACRNLRSLQNLGNLCSSERDFSQGTSIGELPNSVTVLLGNLETLQLENCRNLKYVPKNLGNFSRLKKFSIKFSDIEELPESIVHLGNLEELYLFFCRNLRSLPENLGNLSRLRKMDLGGTGIGELPKSIVLLGNLENLTLDKCPIRTLPENMNRLSCLKSLSLDCCEMLEELPELTNSISYLRAKSCVSLRMISNASAYDSFIKCDFTNCTKMANNLEESILDQLLQTQFQRHSAHEGRSSFEIRYPGSEIPEWFNYQNENGSSITFILPQDWKELRIVGVAYCVVVNILSSVSSKLSYYYKLLVYLNGEEVCEIILHPHQLPIDDGNLMIRYELINDGILRAGENEISFALWDKGIFIPLTPNKCGARLIHGEEEDESGSSFDKSDGILRAGEDETSWFALVGIGCSSERKRLDGSEDLNLGGKAKKKKMQKKKKPRKYIPTFSSFLRIRRRIDESGCSSKRKRLTNKEEDNIPSRKKRRSERPSKTCSSHS